MVLIAMIFAASGFSLDRRSMSFTVTRSPPSALHRRLQGYDAPLRLSLRLHRVHGAGSLCAVAGEVRGIPAVVDPAVRKITHIGDIGDPGWLVLLPFRVILISN